MRQIVLRLERLDQADVDQIGFGTTQQDWIGSDRFWRDLGGWDQIESVWAGLEGLRSLEMTTPQRAMRLQHLRCTALF